MNDNIISVESLNKSFPNFALENVSFVIPRGSLTAVIGRNGAGKTTLFKCIAGLTNFDYGNISIFLGAYVIRLTPNNNHISRLPRQKIGFVFQNMALWPHLTILDNVIKPLVEIHEINKDMAISRAKDWLLNKLKLAPEDLQKYPQQLSVGMQRRVAIARTFVINPDILLIDEIEANLDPEAVENVLRIVRDDFIENPAKTVLMITHRIDFLVSYASKVIILDKGRLIGIGTPQDVLDKPEPQTINFIKEVIDPSMSQWNFAFRCLESSINITSVSLENENAIGGIFQKLSTEVLRLLQKLEPDVPHLVTIVTRDSRDPLRLLLRGICKTEDFILDGDHVEKLDKIVEPESVMLKNRKVEKIEKYKFVENYQNLLDIPGGLPFDTGINLTGSLIALMFKDETKSKYVFADTYPPVEGPQLISLPLKEGSLEKRAYYEFSKATRNVYLFPMEWQEKIIGVLSIDTYSKKKWFPFIAQQLLLVANLGAIAIQTDESQKKQLTFIQN
jgi:ABC-type polar amino acid transport system ATPase subunit